MPENEQKKFKFIEHKYKNLALRFLFNDNISQVQ